MIIKNASPRRGYMRVVFELPASLWAGRIHVLGDFNDWDPTATPLCQERDGVWRALVDLPLGRRYEFCYQIDGRWSTEQHADGLAANEFGTYNSLVDTTPLIRRPDPHLDHNMVHERPQPTPAATGTRYRSPAGPGGESARAG